MNDVLLFERIDLFPITVLDITEVASGWKDRSWYEASALNASEGMFNELVDVPDLNVLVDVPADSLVLGEKVNGDGEILERDLCKFEAMGELGRLPGEVTTVFSVLVDLSF